MRKRLSIVSAATAAFAFALTAHAQDADRSDTDGWYLSASGSVSLIKDAPIRVTGTPNPGGVVESVHAMNTGHGVQGAAGRKFGAFRLEAELGYSTNHSDHNTAIIPPTGHIVSNSRMSALRLMANGYVDFGHGPVQPYLGGGVGWARVNLRIISPRAPLPNETPLRLIDDHNSKFAYQLMAGAAVRINPNLFLTGQYRWLGTGQIHSFDLAGHPYTNRYRGHNLDIGIRVRL